jgi:hypothetical protein
MIVYDTWHWVGPPPTTAYLQQMCTSRAGNRKQANVVFAVPEAGRFLGHGHPHKATREQVDPSIINKRPRISTLFSQISKKSAKQINLLGS